MFVWNFLNEYKIVDLSSMNGIHTHTHTSQSNRNNNNKWKKIKKKQPKVKFICSRH